MDRCKSTAREEFRQGESRNREEREKVRREKMQVREKVGQSRSRERLLPAFCGSGGSKSRLAKAAGAETSGQMRDDKLHAVVARSTFGSEKC